LNFSTEATGPLALVVTIDPDHKCGLGLPILPKGLVFLVPGCIITRRVVG